MNNIHKQDVMLSQDQLSNSERKYISVTLKMLVDSNNRVPLLQISCNNIEDKATQELVTMFGIVYYSCINYNANNQIKNSLDTCLASRFGLRSIKSTKKSMED